jgi:hypothetical protein
MYVYIKPHRWYNGAYRLSELIFLGVYIKSCQYSMFYTNKYVLNKKPGLKNTKSGGLDLILNEFLKYGAHSLLLP